MYKFYLVGGVISLNLISLQLTAECAIITLVSVFIDFHTLPSDCDAYFY